MYSGSYFDTQNSSDLEVKLTDLAAVNLELMDPEVLNKYLLVFDTRFLQVVTPLNFAFYNKFTIEEMITYPILAGVQGSPKLKRLDKCWHGLESSQAQFKEFVLAPPTSSHSPDLCFVSYPADPFASDEADFKNYISSLISMHGHERVSVVVFLPYNAG